MKEKYSDIIIPDGSFCELLNHTLYDTRIFQSAEAGRPYGFFENPIGEEQDGRVKTEVQTNMDFRWRLPKGQQFLVRRIAIVAEKIPMCAVNFRIGCKDYERGHIEHFHQKIGYRGLDLTIWRMIPSLVNFMIELKFDRDFSRDVYEVRAELEGILFRPLC